MHGDDVEDHLGPPEKIARLPGCQTRSSFGRTEANSVCLFCQTKKRDRRDRRRFEDLVGVKETPLQPRSSVQQTWGETRGFFWKFETRICGPKMCYTIDPATSHYTSPSTLKRLVEKELDEEAAEATENARKKAFASLCAFITESIQHKENVTDKSQLCIKYVKFLNDEGVEKVWLEKGLMAISDILLGGCLEAFIPENFLWDFTDWRRRELVHEMIGSSINVVQLSFHDTRPGTHIRINVHTSTAGDSQHCFHLIFLSFFLCVLLSVCQTIISYHWVWW